MTDSLSLPERKTHFAGAIPFLVVAAWIVLAGCGIWSFAAQETEPPAFDVLTYAQKAHNFWNAVAQRTPFNPMNLEPTSRPFGTVLISYPFGFSQDFRGFYFRSMFIPLVLLAVSVLYTIPFRQLSAVQRCVLCAAAIAMASIPALFQFRYDERFSVAGSWGLVDLFLSGAAALTFSFLMRFREDNLLTGAITAALLSVLCFLIKPAGLLVMVLSGFVWLLFAGRSRLRNQYPGRRVALGAFLFLAVCGTAVSWSFSSAYLSPENLQSARRAFAVLRAESVPFNFIGMIDMLRVGIGIPVMLLWCAGFLCALRSTWRLHAFASFVILLSGCLFWLGSAHFSLVRYFLPFAFAAVIVTIPALIDAAENRAVGPAVVCMALFLVPTVGIGSMLASETPPMKLQKVLGINLTVNKYVAEVRQAKDLLLHINAHKIQSPMIYFTELASPVMAFQSVIDSASLYNPSGTQPLTLLSVDWARGSAYRMDELTSSRFIVFQPVAYDDSAGSGPAVSPISTYKEEGRIVNAWLSSLGKSDGVLVLSETSIRVVEIIDRSRFESAVKELVASYQWRPLFLNGYGERWLTAAERAGETRKNVLGKTIELRSLDGAPAAELLGIFFHEAHPEVIVDVWLRPLRHLSASGEMSWFVFFHALAAEGRIQQAPQSLFVNPTAGKSVRQYRFRLPFVPASGAVGVYRPGAKAEFLLSESKDWEGKRVLFTMPDSNDPDKPTRMKRSGDHVRN